MKKVIWSIVGVATLLFLIVVVAAQSEVISKSLGAATQGTDKGVDGPIKIGGAFGQTGICAEFGEGEFRGATLAVEDINMAGGIDGKKLVLVAEDTLCENKGVANATQKLVSIEKVSAIIGPTWGDTFQSGYPISRSANVISIGASSALESLVYTGASNALVFSTWFPQNLEIDALEAYIASQGLKTVYIIHDQDPFGAMMGMLFRDQASRNGLSIIGEEVVATDISDFRTHITRMKSKKPDAVFVSFVSPDHKAIFFKQAKELGFATRLFASADTENPALLASFSDALDGVVFTSPKGATRYDEFAQKYEKRFGEKPRVSSSHAYDAVRVLAAAIKEAKTTDGSDLERALLSVEIPGVTYNTLKFSDKHQIVGGEFVIKTVRNGKFVIISK
ncbi:MAG: Extracellular ligand-binding receptor [Parcubacteria group bacterium GW2011_GWA2_49_9]|nr:MAG: Extracellular ligand-binding receptor [Parcubacteria group bacterium GW2011_GWA2_49_9]